MTRRVGKPRDILVDIAETLAAIHRAPLRGEKLDRKQLRQYCVFGRVLLDDRQPSAREAHQEGVYWNKKKPPS
jgi:hypothetical protein